MEAPALLAFEEDIKSQTWLDRMKAHISLMPPLHRYDGFIKLEAGHLLYSGEDTKTGKSLRFKIDKAQVSQLSLGFDKTYTAFSSKDLGLFWKPLRLRLLNGTMLYLIINYRIGFTDNEFWFNTLKSWLS